MPDLPILWAILLVAGLVRGFAGFGSGMIAIPLISRIGGPAVAIPLFWAIDSLPSLVILLPALRQVAWRAVLPIAAGFAATVYLGIWYLSVGDPDQLRLVISGFILVAVLVLWSGWRYSGPRPATLSAAVGMVSGFFGGATQLSGPPVVIYYLSSADAPAQVRANIIVLFAITSVFSGIGLIAAGLVSMSLLLTAVLVAPAYMIGLLAGQKIFHLADERHFRRVAFLLILTVGLMTLPFFDGVI
ncbi:sulfite exporter TauE/SafE family protein [Notoacmeibacter ruber]|uniref:Probable membrane transporter protein n=1 Tax=Notoacmeibacter ruber TaxID=2670375 RepID=A0A3L7JD21_9HYPH|nr:sulfite exporter TauE/SafE family protein [Notoacmeibacter ruber]RLQ88688.1 sulfite exporter TauE/SafE family protein [Notoacmeibacter ruber]